MDEFNKYKDGSSLPPAASGQPRYLASKETALAVNTALAAELPLLVTGEPGTGKTSLAASISWQLELGRVYRFDTRSDHVARDLLYSFDSLARFHDAQIGSRRALEVGAYIRYEALGAAIVDTINLKRHRVVLIDEIDKAPRDFPNDLLDAIDRMAFRIQETDQEFMAPPELRPIVIITTNGERQLPDPFLRRCVFHHIPFPDAEHLQRIVHEHFPEPSPIYEAAVARLEKLRKESGGLLTRQPGTAELLAWVKVLVRSLGPNPDTSQIKSGQLPFAGVLLKAQEDLEHVLRASA